MRTRIIDRVFFSLIASLLVANSSIAYVSAIISFIAQNKTGMDWEEKYRALPQAERIKESMRLLAAEPHHIGSVAGKRNAEWMRDRMKSWGLDATIEEFDVLFPTPRERALEMVSPETFRAKLKEPAITEDPDSGDENQLPAYNAYSGDGDVTAPLVYVNYINTDSTGKGFFGASGSHTLERFVNEAARSTRDPNGKGSLWDALQSRRAAQAQTAEQKRELNQRKDFPIGALGSGSDYTAFIDHLGIASLNIGFGGESGGGIYHSIHDSFAWYTRFSDSTFEYSRALAQVAGTMMLRLADAKLLPFEFTNFAETVARYADEVAKLPQQGVDLAPLGQSVERLKRKADDYDRALRSVALGGALPADLKAVNMLLYQSERALLSAAGLPRREWFKHQIYAPGFYTGYGVKTLPGVREAIEQKNWSEASEQVKVVGKTIDGMSAQIEAATKKLSGK